MNNEHIQHDPLPSPTYALSELASKVHAETDAQKATALLIDGVAEQVAKAAATGDPRAMEVLAVQLKARADDYGSAVLANTTSEPKPE